MLLKKNNFLFKFLHNLNIQNFYYNFKYIYKLIYTFNNLKFIYLFFNFLSFKNKILKSYSLFYYFSQKLYAVNCSLLNTSILNMKNKLNSLCFNLFCKIPQVTFIVRKIKRYAVLRAPLVHKNSWVHYEVIHYSCFILSYKFFVNLFNISFYEKYFKFHFQIYLKFKTYKNLIGLLN